MPAVPTEISNFFLAMQAGNAAAATMSSLFAENAVYEEPFTGSVQTHRGRDAILATMKAGWQHPLPDMHLTIDRVETAGASVVIDWTCRSPALPGGAGRGRNRFELSDGKITKLVTTLAS